MEHRYIVIRSSFTPYGKVESEEVRTFSDRIEAEKYIELSNQICESNVSYSIKRINITD